VCTDDGKGASRDMASTYKVEDVSQRRRFTPGGQQVEYYDVSITTGKHSVGTLRIAKSDYNASEVKKRLQEFAETLDMPFEV